MEHISMLERHALEQYFWDETTIHRVADVAARFDGIGCLCAPMIGRELDQRGIQARVLDIDERFADLPGFTRFDIYRPHYLNENLGVIICDPPFWIVSLSQLFTSVRLLARYDFEQPLAICYPQRRALNLVSTFARFGLRATGFLPKYRTVQDTERNQIEFFANFDWHEG